MARTEPSRSLGAPGEEDGVRTALGWETNEEHIRPIQVDAERTTAIALLGSGVSDGGGNVQRVRRGNATQSHRAQRSGDRGRMALGLNGVTGGLVRWGGDLMAGVNEGSAKL